jgi:hypothetical protein
VSIFHNLFNYYLNGRGWIRTTDFCVMSATR